MGFQLCLAVVKRSKVTREPVQHAAQISEKFLHIRLECESSVICWPLMVLWYYGVAWLGRVRRGLVVVRLGLVGCGVA